MEFYRIVHHAVASQLPRRPQNGRAYLDKVPYLAGFSSGPAAILEHPVHRETGRLPPSLVLVCYCFPPAPIYTFRQRLSFVNGEMAERSRQAISSFLLEGNMLAGSLPSARWEGVCHLILNPRHELFPLANVVFKGPLYYTDEDPP